MGSQGGKLGHAMRKLHLWLGLVLGGLLVLLGLTGSVLTFYPEIDALLHPEIRVEGSGPPDWDRALATVRSAYPEKRGPWRFEVTDRPGAMPARYYDPPERAGYAFRPMMVWLSPDGERILRRDYWGEYAMTFIYDLHFRLLLNKQGNLGKEVLGWMGFALLALLLTGLWAWWPRGSWAKALRIKPHAPPQRSLRDWHKLTGLIGLLFLALLTVTGIMLELPEQSDVALNAIGLPVDPPPVAPQTNGEPTVLPSEAISAARNALPQARIAWIETPTATGGAYKLRMQVPGDPSFRFPHSFVWVDGTTGQVLAVQDARKASAGTVVNNWLHSLHDGSAAGIWGRSLIALSGLLPLVLFVTGWVRWRLIQKINRSRPQRVAA